MQLGGAIPIPYDIGNVWSPFLHFNFHMKQYLFSFFNTVVGHACFHIISYGGGEHMAMDATMYAAFVQVARAKHVQPYYYGQLQAVSRGAMVPPDVRLERLHRGIQLPLGLG